MTDDHRIHEAEGRAADTLDAARRLSGEPTPVSPDGRCWFCRGGLGHGPDGHRPDCAWVRRFDIAAAVALAEARVAEVDRALLAAEEALAEERAHADRLAGVMREVLDSPGAEGVVVWSPDMTGDVHGLFRGQALLLDVLLAALAEHDVRRGREGR